MPIFQKNKFQLHIDRLKMIHLIIARKEISVRYSTWFLKKFFFVFVFQIRIDIFKFDLQIEAILSLFGAKT